jgi:hypothetical protein
MKAGHGVDCGKSEVHLGCDPRYIPFAHMYIIKHSHFDVVDAVDDPVDGKGKRRTPGKSLPNNGPQPFHQHKLH